MSGLGLTESTALVILPGQSGRVHNDEPKPFMWTKSADQVLESIARFAQRTLDTHGKSNMDSN